MGICKELLPSIYFYLCLYLSAFLSVTVCISSLYILLISPLSSSLFLLVLVCISPLYLSVLFICICLYNYPTCSSLYMWETTSSKTQVGKRPHSTHCSVQTPLYILYLVQCRLHTSHCTMCTAPSCLCVGDSSEM